MVLVIGIGIAIVLVIGAMLAIYLLSAQGGKPGSVGNSLRNLVASQRAQPQTADLREKASRRMRPSLAQAEAEAQLARRKLEKQMTARRGLESRLRYAQWKITPWQFRSIQVLVTIACFIPAYRHAAMSIWLLVLFMMPSVVDGILEWRIQLRVKKFEGDYPVMLLSYVSLLKTGMSSIAGLEAAAKGLEAESLVRTEIELMVERLKLGLTEDQAINGFGEDIAHPEIELFVQSLLLSRKVGGTLSTTLERLARQVRKRQQFKQQAVSVVGMERGSIYAIAFIMTALMLYLAWASPDLIQPAFNDELGNKIFQAGLAMVVLGFYWSRKVTNVKI